MRLFTAFVFVMACGPELTPNLDGDVAGQAFFTGPVTTGNVRLFQLDGRGDPGPVLAQGVVDQEGRFALDVGGVFRGPALLEVRPDTYRDVRDDRQVALPVGWTMHAVLSEYPRTEEVFVTPFTSLLYAMSEGRARATTGSFWNGYQTLAQALEGHLLNIALEDTQPFALTPGFDAGRDEHLYGALLAALPAVAERRALAPHSLLALWEKDVRESGGHMDGWSLEGTVWLDPNTFRADLAEGMQLALARESLSAEPGAASSLRRKLEHMASNQDSALFRGPTRTLSKALPDLVWRFPVDGELVPASFTLDVEAEGAELWIAVGDSDWRRGDRAVRIRGNAATIHVAAITEGGLVVTETRNVRVDPSVSAM